MLKVETIPNDKTYKNTIVTNYRKPCVQSILFGNLYGFVDLKSYHNLIDCDKLKKKFKWFSKDLVKRIDRIIDEFNNLQITNTRDIERVHKDLLRQFANRSCYGYACPQFELELR